MTSADEIFTADDHDSAEMYPTLGADYFAANRAAEALLKKWQEEHAERLAAEIVTPIVEQITRQVEQHFRDYLLQDVETNCANDMRRMVEDSVSALIGGRKWAHVKYIETKYRDGREVRETLAALHSDTIKDGRIADLEKEVSNLRSTLAMYRGGA